MPDILNDTPRPRPPVNPTTEVAILRKTLALLVKERVPSLVDEQSRQALIDNYYNRAQVEVNKLQLARVQAIKAEKAAQLRADKEARREEEEAQ